MLEQKKRLVNCLLDRGILVSSDIIDQLDDHVLEELNKYTESLFYLNKDTIGLIKKGAEINWAELLKMKVQAEKNNQPDIYRKFIECTAEPEKKEEQKSGQKKDMEIIFDYKKVQNKKKIQDFVSYFNNRFRQLRDILMNREELISVTSINRLLAKKEKETVSLIGMVKDKAITKNNNVIITLEDPTGEINVLVNKNREDLYRTAKNIVFDEVVGVRGVITNGIIFTESIIFPEIPHIEVKKHPEEVYAVFLSDIHVGSKNFLEEPFQKFLRWIKGEIGSIEQKAIVSKIKYLFIVGDLVDGVGIYPGQEEELNIKDVKDQYKKCAGYLSQIPTHIKIVVCPGNHDAVRISEPQPCLDNEFAGALALPNVTLVSNPSCVRIAITEDFPGFDILLYHGFSFDYFIANVDSIRMNGGYDRADLIMRFLLRRRHLAPSHKSTLYLPDTEEDPLVIKKIPDFFVTGHIHKTAVSSYKGITLICGSCWQSTTSFQEKVGHHPEPCRVPLVNLQTRQVKILRF